MASRGNPIQAATGVTANPDGVTVSAAGPTMDGVVDAAVTPGDQRRSRRDLIRAGLAGAAALAIGSAATPESAEAAAGGNMLLGRANSAGTAGTSLATKSTAAALTVAQTGTGPGIRASAKTGPAATLSSSAGNGLTVASASVGRQAIRASNTAAGAGTAIRATAFGATDSTIAALGRLPAAGEFASAGTAIVAVGGDTGVFGDSTGGTGVAGRTDTGTAVYAAATTTGTGVFAYSASSYAVSAYTGSGVAIAASSTTGKAMAASSGSETAVRAVADALETAITDQYLIPGVLPAAGEFAGSGGGVIAVAGTGHIGVLGIGPGAGVGVEGRSDSGNGVFAKSESGYALYASSNSGTAVVANGSATGINVSASAGKGIQAAGTTYGVFGDSSTGVGVRGQSTGYVGVEAVSAAGSYPALSAYNTGTGWGILCYSRSQFYDNLGVTGTLTKGGGTFRIDHPLDPAHKFLSHSFVESPDMKNVYDGVVELDANGEATVTLPDWFEALNRDFRYQLTPMGASMPALFVAREFNGTSFAIGGGVAKQKVSWQMTGIRKDAWAEANRTPVEEDKTGDEVGLYLHPKEHGRPESKGIGFAMRQRQGADRPKG